MLSFFAELPLNYGLVSNIKYTFFDTGDYKGENMVDVLTKLSGLKRKYGIQKVLDL